MNISWDSGKIKITVALTELISNDISINNAVCSILF